MIRTRVGYSGGTTENPDYEELGDHTETVQVDYDPRVVTYDDLLDVFWRSHNPAERPWSRQYRAAIFASDEGQRAAAERSLKRVAELMGGRVHTAIEPLGAFYIAEDYHQKYYLRHDPVLMEVFRGYYPDAAGLVDSPAAAKVNGYLSGMGDGESLARLLPGLGLPEEAQRRLLLRSR